MNDEELKAKREALVADYAEWQAALLAHLRTLAAPAGVPSGWKLVPLEPTSEMMDAAEECSTDWPRTTWAEAYSAMLAAAPTREKKT